MLKVGGDKNPGPVHRGLFVTYDTLSERKRYQMWIGQTWQNIEDSPSIKAARASIKKRSAGLDTYAKGDVVKVVSSGKGPTMKEKETLYRFTRMRRHGATQSGQSITLLLLAP
jgi:hypothetical protein